MMVSIRAEIGFPVEREYSSYVLSGRAYLHAVRAYMVATRAIIPSPGMSSPSIDLRHLGHVAGLAWKIFGNTDSFSPSPE